MKQATKAINRYAIYLLFLFPILPFGLRSVLLGLFGLSSLAYCVQYKTKINLKKLIYFVLPFVLVFLSVFYSDNQKYGLKMLEIMSATVIIPLGFSLCSNQIDSRLINNCKNVFLIAVLIFFVYLAVQCGLNYEQLTADLSADELKYNGLTPETLSVEKINKIKVHRFRELITNLTNTHTTYAGTYAIIAIYLLLEKLKNARFFGKIGVSVGVVFLLSTFVISAARAPILVAFVALVLLSTINKTIKPIYWIAPVLIVLFGIVVTPNLNSRVTEVINNKFELPKRGNDVASFNSVNVRLGCYYCATQVFLGHIWTGTGLGDLQDDLDRCYTEKIGASIYTWTEYNTHNQYLFFAAAGGVLAVLAFVWLLLYHLISSFLVKDDFWLYLTIVFSGLFLTENMLCRSDGIMTFMLFLGMLNFKKEKNASS